MSAEATWATAEKLVAYCRADTTGRALDELYDPQTVSIEARAMPGTDSAEARGLDAIRGKHDWWDRTMEVREFDGGGTVPHGEDRFAVIFGFDATNRETGDRIRMQEVAIYTVDAAARIVREEFFYAT